MEPKTKKSQLTESFYAGCYAVYYAYPVKYGSDLQDMQSVVKKHYAAFLNDSEMGPSWRAIASPKKLERLRGCQPFPNPKGRPNTCLETSTCPWCYASSVEKLFHKVWDALQEPEMQGKWLSITQRITNIPLIERGIGEEDIAYRDRARQQLIDVFDEVNRKRTADNRNNKTIAAVRYADVSRAMVPQPKRVAKKFIEQDGNAYADPATIQFTTDRQLINRALSVTDDVVRDNLLSEKHSRRIDGKLTKRAVAAFLGKTLQQSKANILSPAMGVAAIIYAKKLTNHRTFLTYGAFRNKNVESYGPTLSVNRSRFRCNVN